MKDFMVYFRSQYVVVWSGGWCCHSGKRPVGWLDSRETTALGGLPVSEGASLSSRLQERLSGIKGGDIILITFEDIAMFKDVLWPCREEVVIVVVIEFL